MEVKCIVGILNPLVVGEKQVEGNKRRHIFLEEPCLGMDNHFSGEHVNEFLGENGYKTIHTTTRGRLEKDLKQHYHHQNGVEVGPRSKSARFEHPIIAVKKVKFPGGSDKNSYCVVHISFQSTGSTNITTVNVLGKVELYVRHREKGKGETKRIWDIEMNEGREFYLKVYGGVDKLDQILKDWGMR